MNGPRYGLLENYKNLGIGIIEFAIDDYVSTAKSLSTYYKKLVRCLEEDFKARKHHERLGDVCYDIVDRIHNLQDIEQFLTGDWVKELTDLDATYLLRETKKQLREKGYKIGLMGLIVKTDDKGVKIFANEMEGAYGKFTKYSIGIATKKKDGTWVNGFIDCSFKKGVSVANKSKIKINNSFFYPNKRGDKTYNNLMIMDFEVLESGETAANDADEFMKIPEGADEDTPFL